MFYPRDKYKIRTDFIVVVGMVLLFIPTAIFFKAGPLTATILFFAVPALYLLIRQPKQLKRLAATLLVGMIASIAFDLVAEYNNAWIWSPINQPLFPYKLFGIIWVDVLIWYFFWILITIVYYEHFFERKKFESEKISPQFKKLIIFFSAVLILTVALYYLRPEALKFKYAYLYLGLLISTPLYYLIYKKSRLAGKLLKAGLFSIFLFLSYELTALYLDLWRFPGNYIGQVQLFGIAFPFEEFVFWIILGAPASLSFYELYVDDGK